MNNKLCAGPLLLSIVMSGCAAARMYPVQGPQWDAQMYPVGGSTASQSPGRGYTVKLTGLLYSGDIKITTPAGEVCKGHWSLVKGGNSPDPSPSTTPNSDATSGPTGAAIGMPAAWDIVYGQGYYVAHVLGERLYAHSVVTGDRGTVLNVEFYRRDRGTGPDAPFEIHGVAKDNQGDIFKLAF